ncbi:MAG: hypothetical protein R2939_09810 [Kofleriaceae bacterium]
MACRGLVVVLVATMTMGCLADGPAPCADGSVCADGLACAPAGGCVDGAQLAACEGLADGDDCLLAGVGAGTCVDGVCRVVACGDGRLDPGEACDDGNDVDDDECTNACARPTCGDGVVSGDEACDAGAANGDDRACTSRCLEATCGDNLLQVGVEECDAGPDNADDEFCTTACIRNVCGDGLVFAGVEACDDGNQASGDGCRADCGKVEACGDAAVDAGEACDDGNANPADGCDACVATSWTAEVLLGGAVPAVDTELFTPMGLAIDASGRLYVADTGAHRIRRLETDGTMTVVAGSGLAGDAGDGGDATAARLDGPRGTAVDGLGRIYVADTENHRVRRVDLDGRIVTLAGTGVAGAGANGTLATSAALNRPFAVAVDGLGRVAIADTGNHRVVVVGLDGVIGVYQNVAPGASMSPSLSSPSGVAFAADGTLWIADTANDRLVRVPPGGTAAEVVLPLDPELDALDRPWGLAFAPDGGLYVSEERVDRVRRIEPDGAGVQVFPTGGAQPSDGAAPRGLAVGADGALRFADVDKHRVLRLADGATAVEVVAGNGIAGYFGDGGLGTSAQLVDARHLARDAEGRVYIADRGADRIRRLDLDGTIVTVVGGGVGPTIDITPGSVGGEQEPPTLDQPTGLAFDAQGRLLVSDQGANQLLRFDLEAPFPTWERVAGTGALCGAAATCGDGGPARAALLNAPAGLIVDPLGVIYVADSGSNRVRRIATNGTITTVIGASLGTPLTSPRAVELDGQGRLLVADAGGVRRLGVGGLTTVVDRCGVNGGVGVATMLAQPVALSFTTTRELLIADAVANVVCRWDGTSATAALLLGGTPGFRGDGAPPTPLTRIWGPTGVLASDEVGDLSYLITDGVNDVVRQVAPTRIVTVAGAVDPERTGPVGQARLADPQALQVADGITYVAGGASATAQLMRGDELRTFLGLYPQSTPTGNLARFRDASFRDVQGLAYDPARGALFVTSGNAVLSVDVGDGLGDVTTWTVETLVGDLTAGAFVDGALADAQFRSPSGLFVDATTGLLYVADTGNHVVRVVDLGAATVTTLAGTPETLGYFGDGQPADEALLFAPRAITRCGDTLYVADTGNHRVRRVGADGLIDTVLGDGVEASSGEGSPSMSFPVAAPSGLACDPFGNLAVSSSTAVRLLVADDGGVIDGQGPVQTIHDGGAAACLTGVAAIDATTWQVVDACAGALLELWRQPLTLPP